MRNTKLDLGTMVYGKVPPQNTDAEQVILGAIMIEKGTFERVSELLKPEHFYKESHGHIYRAIQSLSLSGKNIDTITVGDQLEKDGYLELVGGSYYVTQLTNGVVSSRHIENHIHIIYEAWLKREVIKICGESISDAYDSGTDAFDLVNNHERSMEGISNARNINSITPLENVLVDRMKRLGELQKRQSNITGVPSGFRKLDQVTHGWQNTDLIILAARPSVGKTAFALNVARNAAVSKGPKGEKIKVLLVSLEMSTGQLADRILSLQSEFPLEKISTGNMAYEQLGFVYTNGVQKFADSGIFIDDTAALNIYDLKARVRRIKRDHCRNGEQLIVLIDYLQLMNGLEAKDKNNRNREQEISHISRNLKQMAKEENIPVIALSQLSRAVEQRGSKEGSKIPQLSDLRESGAIEQDADVVMFLYRPEYYDINQNEMGESTLGLTEIKIAKHRNGTLDTIKLKARLDIQKFEDWSEVFSPPPASDNRISSWRPIDEPKSNKDDLNMD